ncbi:YfiR family protein [Spongorhabdus nitratireducens]
MKSARTPFTLSVPSLSGPGYGLALRLLLALLFLSVSGFATSEKKPKASEEKVKTAIIYNIIRFTDWPYNNREIRLCLLGSGIMPRALNAINGKEVSGRTIVVKPRISPEYMTRECDALYISDSSQSQLSGVLKQLRNSPVLTLSDMNQFPEQGGMIGLYRNAGKVNFAININAVQNARLMVSSQILKLARIVDK